MKITSALILWIVLATNTSAVDARPAFRNAEEIAKFSQETGGNLTAENAKVLSKFTAFEAFRYFTGYYSNLGNMPALYASSAGFTVVGQGVDRTFETLAPAMEFYRSLICGTPFYASACN